MSVVVECGYDAARSGTIGFTVTETGGGGASVAVSLTGAYFWTASGALVTTQGDDGIAVTTDIGYSSLKSAINTALLPLNSDVTVAINASNKLVFTSDGTAGVTAIAISAMTTAAQQLMASGGTFTGTALVKTGTSPVMRRILSALDGVTSFHPPTDRGDELAVDLIANDGTHEGIAMPRAAKRWEVVFPYEPKGTVWATWRDNPQTWELLFAQARNIEPIALIFTTDPMGGAYSALVMRLAEDTCAFEPELLGEEYFAYAHVPLRGYFLGYVD